MKYLAAFDAAQRVLRRISVNLLELRRSWSEAEGYGAPYGGGDQYGYEPGYSYARQAPSRRYETWRRRALPEAVGSLG